MFDRGEKRRKKFRKMSHLLLFSRLGINSAIINCENIINSRFETRRGDGNRFKMREECARESKEERDYDEGQESDDNERGVNHSDQTVLLTIRAIERKRLCI